MTTAQKIAETFIAYLKEQERFDELPAIVQALQEEVLRNQDISVIVAVELSAAEQKSVSDLLTKKWGERRVIFTIDPALLSGMIVRFRDIILDLSGKHDLHDLAHTLRN
jgi:ATP synthase F1 delta subunit